MGHHFASLPHEHNRECHRNTLLTTVPMRRPSEVYQKIAQPLHEGLIETVSQQTKFNKVTNLVDHPPIKEAPREAIRPMAPMMTKDERKKMRRRRREEVHITREFILPYNAHLQRGSPQREASNPM